LSSAAAAIIEKEQFSPLIRSLALLVALNDLLSPKPAATEHERIAAALFPDPGQAKPAFVEAMLSPCWSDLKQAYRLASEVQQLLDALASTQKTLPPSRSRTSSR
jgi:hypothetical protein